MSILKFCLRLGIGASLVAYLFYEHEVHLREVGETIVNLPLHILLLAFLVDLGGQTLSAYRWSKVSTLGGCELSFRRAFPIYFTGMFFNICLPTSIGGDVVKIVSLQKRTGSKSSAFASVFMDRNIGMAALLLLGTAASLWSAPTLEATFYGVTYKAPLWPFFVLLIAGYILANAALFGRASYSMLDGWVLRRLPDSWRAKVDKLHANLQCYRLKVTAYAVPFVISLCYQASEALIVWLLAWGLGLSLSFWIFAALVTFQAVAGLLPITVNNIGVREGLFCAVLLGQTHAAGMSPEQIKTLALSTSLIYFGLIVASGLAGGVVYLVAGVSRPTKQEIAEAAAAN